MGLLLKEVSKSYSYNGKTVNGKAEGKLITNFSLAVSSFGRPTRGNPAKTQDSRPESKPNEGKLEVIQSLSLEVENSTFVSLIGPSGCGKSTLCNLISGLESPDQGEILLDGLPIQGRSGHVGYMPQKDLLLPWRTLLENVTLGPEIRRQDKEKSRAEAREWLERFGLQPFAHHYPHELSGGMRQRGAFLRTILFGQNTLLLDEPFGALDALTRHEMQCWLLTVWNETRHTVLFITHDIEEAILLSDKVVVLSKRPAHAVRELKIPFPRPRNPELLLSNEGVALKKELLGLLFS